MNLIFIFKANNLEIEMKNYFYVMLLMLYYRYLFYIFKLINFFE